MDKSFIIKVLVLSIFLFNLIFADTNAYSIVPMVKNDYYFLPKQNYSLESADKKFRFEIQGKDVNTEIHFASYIPFLYKFPQGWEASSFVLDLDNPNDLDLDVYFSVDPRINKNTFLQHAKKRIFKYINNTWVELKDNYEVLSSNLVKVHLNESGKYVLLVNMQEMEIGDASWYKYKNCMCAASPDYPKGTKLLVSDLDTGKSIEVTVNDWGPERDKFPHRIIDLDAVAFEALGWNLSVGILHNIKVTKIEK